MFIQETLKIMLEMAKANTIKLMESIMMASGRITSKLEKAYKHTSIFIRMKEIFKMAQNMEEGNLLYIQKDTSILDNGRTTQRMAKEDSNMLMEQLFRENGGKGMLYQNDTYLSLFI
jgi:hypothetical protein